MYHVRFRTTAVTHYQALRSLKRPVAANLEGGKPRRNTAQACRLSMRVCLWWRLLPSAIIEMNRTAGAKVPQAGVCTLARAGFAIGSRDQDSSTGGPLDDGRNPCRPAARQPPVGCFHILPTPQLLPSTQHYHRSPPTATPTPTRQNVARQKIARQDPRAYPSRCISQPRATTHQSRHRNNSPCSKPPPTHPPTANTPLLTQHPTSPATPGQDILSAMGQRRLVNRPQNVLTLHNAAGRLPHCG